MNIKLRKKFNKEKSSLIGKHTVINLRAKYNLLKEKAKFKE